MKPTNKSQTSPAESTLQPGAVEDYMNRSGIPLTRKNFLDLAYPDGLPKEWTQELEMELPDWARKAEE